MKGNPENQERKNVHLAGWYAIIGAIIGSLLTWFIPQIPAIVNPPPDRLEQLLNDANAAFAEEDYNGSFVLYQQATDLGSVDAYCQLGYMYSKGYGVNVDPARAQENYEKAIMRGSKLAVTNNLAMNAYKPIDYDSLISAFRMAFEYGDDSLKNVLIASFPDLANNGFQNMTQIQKAQWIDDNLNETIGTNPRTFTTEKQSTDFSNFKFQKTSYEYVCGAGFCPGMIDVYYYLVDFRNFETIPGVEEKPISL